MNEVTKIITSSLEVKKKLLADNDLITAIEKAVHTIVECYKNNGKVLFCGNGGSASDAQHLAAELTGRFYYDRPPLDAEALNANTSHLTAVANDYAFEKIFSRLVEAKGNAGDVLVGLSTSGNSPNVVLAAKTARKKQMTTITMTGSSGGKLQEDGDINIAVPSLDTPRIQEVHILVGHIICEMVEQELFPKA